MNPLRFHGNSDDTFGEYGRRSIDHDNCASGDPIRFLVKSGKDSLIVSGQYGVGPGATWTVGVEQVDDERPLPPWPIRLRACRGCDECGYSPTLEIDAPDGASVTLVKDD